MFLISPPWTLSAGQKDLGMPLVVVQSLSHVWLIVTPWTAARQAQRPLWSSRILIWKIFNRWGRLSLSNASAFPQVTEKSVPALPLPSPLHSGVCMVSQFCPTHLFSSDVSAVGHLMTLFMWLRNQEWRHTIYSIPPPLSALTLTLHNFPKSMHLSPCEVPSKASSLVLFPKLSGGEEPVSPSCFLQSLLEFWWMYFFLPC